MMYQKPENYVRNFIDSILSEIGGVKREEVTAEGLRLFVDYQYGEILIEAKAPGKRKEGREQLLNYMEHYSGIGLLVDVPVVQYYEEYPRPFEGRVGFELYLKRNLIYERSFDRSEIDYAKREFAFLLKVIKELRVASLEPRPEAVLLRVRDMVKTWEGRLMAALTDAPSRVKTYISIWRRNMEVLYGEDILKGVERNLIKLFVELTIYTATLKVLGSTILESMLGGGRYTIPLKLLQEGHRAAIELFWERRALTRFNINYLFERDEYDWVFSPEVAERVDGFFKDIGRKLVEVDWNIPVSLDLLKRVYQNIVDTSLRKQLGEFYTPDWLAKLIVWRTLHVLVRGEPPANVLSDRIDCELVDLIDEFYKKTGRIPRFIDPTCGSFTFGIQCLDALLKWYNKKRPGVHPIDFAYKILQNIIGIDLNPVAVITAKVNYLLQVHRLLTVSGNYLYEEPMIPVYRVDLLTVHEVNSVCAKERIKERTKVADLLYYLRDENQELTLSLPLSSIGVDENLLNKLREEGIPIDYDRDFNEHYIRLSIPRSLIKKLTENQVKLHRALIALSKGVDSFMHEAGIELDSEERSSLGKIIRVINILEKYGLDGVWYSIFTNHILTFAAVEKKFDLVLGNLPWVNVSKYPQKYGDKLRGVARELGVYPPREAAKKLDVSAILYAVSAKYLLVEGGVVGLMVPTSIFRGLHGSGWRSFFAREKLRIYEVFNLEGVQPFERAQNQPGIVLAGR